MTELVQTELRPAQGGKTIAILTLNNPKALNAQNLTMVQHTAKHLSDWAADDGVAMVVLRGAGDRALCAGGDIKSLQTKDVKAEQFFEEEYALLHQMHTYPKPILAWGNGVVMGGGLGLLAASSHKVVNATTLMAMPEVSIGLFPDAGGSYFLAKMPAKLGLFLGLTGARFNGADARHLGLADFVICHDKFDEVLRALMEQDWQNSVDKLANHHVLSACLQRFHEADDLPKGVLSPHFELIHRLMNTGNLLAVNEAILTLETDDEWLKQSIENYRAGSATTKALTWQIYHNLHTVDKGASLQQVFEMETKVAVRCVLEGDFAEGVRALLIDKDKSPKWRYTLQNMPAGYIERYFV